MKTLVVRKPIKQLVISVFLIMCLLGLAQVVRMAYYPPEISQAQPVLTYNIEAPLTTKLNLLPNSMYEKPFRSEGELVIRELVKSVNSNIQFKISADENAEITGTLTALIHLKAVYGEEGETLWDKTFVIKQIPIQAMGEFSYEGYFEDTLAACKALLEKSAAETDLSPGAVAEVGYSYQGTVSKDGEQLKFDGSKLTIVPMTLDVYKIEAASTGKDSDALMKTVMVKSQYDTASQIPFYILSGFGLLAAGLSYVFIKNKPEKSEYTKSIDEIFNAYGDRLAKLEEALPNQFANVIYVNDFADLVKISDEIRQPVFYYKIDESDEQKIEFYVFDEMRIYYLVKYEVLKQTMDEFLEQLA